MTNQLPIVPYLTSIREKLENSNVILSAAPGAGKSTVLLLDLLRNYPLNGKKVLVLQPRRVIVRALAGYLAEQIAEPIGQSVGYRIRGENKVSDNTRLEIVTEAILTRRLQADPELSDVSVIVFDEFHERNVHSDFSLALAIESQAGLRDDLRLLVMSATLDMQSLLTLMPEATHFVIEGRQFPIEFNYRPLLKLTHRNALETAVTDVIIEALSSHSEDILVFMPSVRAIQAVCELLKHALNKHQTMANIDVLPLYGALGRSEQQRAIAPHLDGRRKVVVATNIAETSLTIEGIGVVIDSGLERRLKIDLRTGIEGLVTTSISQASAYQRAGRAGRLQAGYCYRLWSQEAQSRMAEQSPPEITQRDISDFVLQALAWGTQLADLPLLTQPTSGQLLAAATQLHWLEAVDADGGLTRHGRQLTDYGTELRLAHMQLNIAQRFPHSAAWTHATAAISVFLERFTGHPAQDCEGEFTNWSLNLDNAAQQQIKKGLQRASVKFERALLLAISSEHIVTCLAIAYPDWVGFHVGRGRYKLANGKQAVLSTDDSINPPQWLAVGGLRQSDQSIIYITLFQMIDDNLVNALLAPQFETRGSLVWDEANQRFSRFEQTAFGEILIKQQPLPFTNKGKDDQDELKQSWASVITKKGLAWLPIPETALNFLHRCRLAERLCQRDDLQPIADFTEQGLLNSLAQWLLPYLDDSKDLVSLKRLNWQQLFQNRLNWQQQQWVDNELPSHFTLPTGDRVKLDYSNIDISKNTVTNGPIAAARMQFLYGLQDSPMLAEGQLTITFELLSPAQRPIQTTSELGKFWQSDSYVAIKKEMKGRYPKHLWPDDPANTAPTTRVKKYT